MASSQLTRRLRGGDFRHAVQAVAALRLLDRREAIALVPVVDTADEQRAFQISVARIVAEGGVEALARQWRDLPSPELRARLVVEIGGSIAWVDEATIELLIAALEDPQDTVARRAVKCLESCLQERPPRERRQMERTRSGKVALDALDRLAAFVTQPRRLRIARAVGDALERCAANPKALTWPDAYIALLGLTAGRADTRAISVLEGLRGMAGETRRSHVEKLDPDNLPWPTSVLAAKKGVRPVARVWSLGTGLLDLARLEAAIAGIRGRT